MTICNFLDLQEECNFVSRNNNKANSLITRPQTCQCRASSAYSYWQFNFYISHHIMFFVISTPVVALILLLIEPSFASRRANFNQFTVQSNLLNSRSRVSPSIKSAPQLYQYDLPKPLEFLKDEYGDEDDYHKVQHCSANSGLTKNILRGAFLRVASDLSGATPLESIKCRVTVTLDGPIAAYRNIVEEKGFFGLWTGTPSRTVEGALLGAIFMLASATTKKYMSRMGASRTQASLAAGLVGGAAQSVVMTPAAMVFTSLNINSKKRQGTEGGQNENTWTVTKRIVQEKGIVGMFAGIRPMAIRQSTNWASRSAFTEICRSTLKLSQYGIAGEIASGVIGGVGSCWNTPIETIRALMQRDVSNGKPVNKVNQYVADMVEEQGYRGLFRGVTPRAAQAIWQTVFMVVVPNMLEI